MIEIDYDPAKRARTLLERGLDMACAGEVFDGVHLTIADDREDYGEDRFITVGHLNRRLVILVWTPRNGNCRVISLRKANDREQRLYGPKLE